MLARKRSRRSGSGCESAGRKEKKSKEDGGREARARGSERRIVSRVPSAAIARQIYLCILRALGADRRNTAQLKRPRFSRFSVHARELSAIRQIYRSRRALSNNLG